MLVVAHQSIAREGERHCGDIAISRRSGHLHLVAVVDALGHGEGAWRVAEKALRYLDVASLDAGVKTLLVGLHAALDATRGAAAMIALFDGRTLTAGGAGNVECRGLSRPFPFVPVPGIIGGRVHPWRIASVDVHAGDRFALFSDGLSRRTNFAPALVQSPRDACAAILAAHRNATDDATLLVAEVALGVSITPKKRGSSS
jgi:negative regulator of sigma-B (phosphoserine phosphatase)